MNVTTSESAKDLIVKILLNKPQKAKIIHKLLNEFKVISLPATYKWLNDLLAEKVLIKEKLVYSVNNEWRQKTIELLSRVEDNLLLQNDRLVYDVSTASQCDELWKHYAFLLLRQTKTPILYYNHHQFWYYLTDRQISELHFMEHTKTAEQLVLHTIGADTRFDQMFAKKFRSPNYRINVNQIKQLKIVDNITIFGDYIINTKVPVALAREIDTIYKLNDSEFDLIQLLNKLLSNEYKFKFVLERNRTKAAYYRKLLTEDFALAIN